MRKTLALLLLLAMATPAWAGNSTVSLNYSLTAAPDSTLGAYGVAVGYDLGLLRVAVEYTRYNDFEMEWSQAVDRRADPLQVALEANVQTAFITAALDFENTTAWTPYVQVGGGWAFYELNVDWRTIAHITVFPWPTMHVPLEQSVSWTQRTPAWFLGAGVQYDLGFVLKGLSVDAGVRYLDLGVISPPDITVEKMGFSKTIDLDSQRVLTVQGIVGLTYRF